MTDEKKGIKKVGVYEYEPICTRNYDGLECDGECTICDNYASDKAAEADYNRREEWSW